MSKFQRMTTSRRMTLSWLVAVFLSLTLGQRSGHADETRFALVIGNDEYKSAKLATPANDAGLVADALTAAGFTVTGARNLDQATLRESFREFLGQAAAAGPDAVVVVYLAGFGVQFAGENYFVPVDADVARDVDVPLQAVRVSDFAQPLAALPGRVKIVIVDAARQNPFARGGDPLASGLALVDPASGMAVAFNAAPGTVGPDEPGPYGAYATALTEMIAAGGLALDDVFARVRLRVSEVTGGGEVPWYASRFDEPFFFTERTADAPPPPNVVPLADLRDKPMRSYSSVDDAYAAAIALDTMEGYEQFLAIYPSSPFSRRIAAMLAVRREEITWRRCVFNNTPPAYWSYLRRYPKGPHAWDARRRLGMLGAPFEGPPDFALYDFGVPPPPPDEMGFIDRPVVMFWGPGYEPPPRPPAFFLPPRPREFGALPPPPAPRERFFLPAPGAAVVPAFVRPAHRNGPTGAARSGPRPHARCATRRCAVARRSRSAARQYRRARSRAGSSRSRAAARTTTCGSGAGDDQAGRAGSAAASSCAGGDQAGSGSAASSASTAASPSAGAGARRGQATSAAAPGCGKTGMSARQDARRSEWASDLQIGACKSAYAIAFFDRTRRPIGDTGNGALRPRCVLPNFQTNKLSHGGYAGNGR